MKFQIFQSQKGDCLLLEADSGATILCDGGMRASYTRHVAPALGQLRARSKKLDLVYVSHIDQDHIAGVLQLADDLAEWRVYEHQKKNGNTHVRAPKAPYPPEVRAIWHNAFHEQIGRNSGEIADLLAASAGILAASSSPKVQEISEEHTDLALSQMEAMRLSRRIGAAQLGIPLNAPAHGKLMYVRPGQVAFALGKLKVFIIGPFEADLAELRKKWNAWLRENRDRVEDLRKRSVRDEESHENAVPSLFRHMALAADELGVRDRVTAPNLASLMLYIEEPKAGGSSKTYLFTGDGHGDDIVKGLLHHQKLNQNAGKGLHVDVLKFPHHGSENNINAAFLKAITADHYIFCGNGEHANPDLAVVKAVVDSRVGSAATLSANAQVGNSFKLWFSSGPKSAGDTVNTAHMGKIEKLLLARQKQHPRLKFHFNERDSATFAV